MKTLTVILMLSLVIPEAFGQKVDFKELPPPVKETYVRKNKDTLNTKWEKKETIYTGRFSKNKQDAVINIRDNGEWINTRWELPVIYLPHEIKDYIAKYYADFKIKNAVVEYLIGGVFFLVGIKKGTEDPVVRFSVKSQFVGPEP